MSHYTFLPWLRRGAIRLANAPSTKERLAIEMRLNVVTEAGEDPDSITRKAQLYGPGDISGVDWRAIVRTVPRANVRDFEANFLASIEFYDEDFPWRYTPALPDPATGKLNPWIWLTVLEESEYRRLNTVAGQLPVIEILPAALSEAFPDPATTSAWAHVQLNFKPTGANHKGLLDDVQDQLNKNPNLGCARLLCPRRLKPQTRYRAFLLPAFEKGRLAGLGMPETAVAATPNAQPSWPKIEPGQSVNATPFPVYFEWEFATSSAGDFEDLARKLKPISIEEKAALAGAAQLLDVSDPGWGITGVSGAIRMESALKLPTLFSSNPEEEATKKKLRKELAPLLDLGVQPLDNITGKEEHPYFQDNTHPEQKATLDDDPIVVPPMYGSFYRAGETMQSEATQDWFHQLNLDPVYRVAAAQGTAVVQKNQEEYMDRAWDQWSVYAEIQKTSRRWEFSLQVSQTMFIKRVDPILANNNQPEASYRAVGFFAPMHTSIRMRGQNNQITGNLTSSLRETRWPSVHAPSFNKITRTGGPLMRRFQQNPPGVLFLNAPHATFILVANPPVNLKKAVETIVTHLSKNSDLASYLQGKGFGGLDPCKTAFAGWQQQHLAPDTPPAPPLVPNTGLWLTTIRAEIQPSVAIAQRFNALVEMTYPAVVNPAAPPPDAPVFKEPMYKELADRSSDFILPGLDRIPVNRVAILEPNQAFVEGYLTGLNHEMAREFLWREFPAPLNATYFHQFWDVRNASEGVRDILPIGSWKKTALGTHRPPPPVTPLVVVLRGDLLRKYPNTEVFMVQASWKNKQAGTHGLSLDLAKPEQWANTASGVLRPIFSARLEPDYQFLGFAIESKQARGTSADPGWFVVLRERAGEVHFGLDITTETPEDPSWEALNKITENQCIDTESAQFAKLPRSGKRADELAVMLYQKPFMSFIHASQLLPED